MSVVGARPLLTVILQVWQVPPLEDVELSARRQHRHPERYGVRVRGTEAIPCNGTSVIPS